MDDRVGTTNASHMNLTKVDNPPKLDKSKTAFFEDVQSGLSQSQKTLPCKYFYDQKGSELFEKICQLDEYYITRTELALLKSIQPKLTQLIGKNAVIIEPGAGAGIKIRTLLSALDSPLSYVPMDISKDFLFYSADVIQTQFPSIDIVPIQGDFTQPVKWLDKNQHDNRVVFFPGSTIGNFEKDSAVDFLVNMHDLVGEKGALIIGADLLKEKEVLEAAYDDSKGVTAEFNKNLLTRINTELRGNFNLTQFTHKALLNDKENRIEMHLISDVAQQVNISGKVFSFFKGESIHTENSHKYSRNSFLAMADEAGFKAINSWTDPEELFAIHYLVQK